jgi:hypothetical protein
VIKAVALGTIAEKLAIQAHRQCLQFQWLSGNAAQWQKLVVLHIQEYQQD